MNTKKFLAITLASSMVLSTMAAPAFADGESTLVPETVSVEAAYDGTSSSAASFDLIALAKAAGANDSLNESDTIKVSFDLAVNAAPSTGSCINITSAAGTSVSTGADANRFALFQFNQWWNQLDVVDNTQGMNFTDFSDPNQWLNCVGKFDYTTVSEIDVAIDYANKTITVTGVGSGDSQSGTSYTFTEFPSVNKGSLYLTATPGVDYAISNVEVTYNKDLGAVTTVEDTVSLEAAFDSTEDAATCLDLVALATAAGADATSLAASNKVTVGYDLAVNAAPSSLSNINITSASGTSIATGADANRFALFSLNIWWNQLDVVDCTQALDYGNTSDTTNQWLNVTGKFDYSTKNHIDVTIDYTNQTVTVTGSGSGDYQSMTTNTFNSFPASATKGSLYLTATADSDYEISNITVTYDKIEAGEEPSEPAVYNAEIAKVNSWSGEGYVGEATALTATFTVEADQSFNTVTVASAADAANAQTKTVTTVTGGTAVYGIVVTSICEADAVVATATLAE